MNTSIRFPNLDLEFGYVGNSVSVFGVEITFYGMLITAGMLLALLYMILHARRKKEDENLCLEMLIPSLTGGVIGARLLYIVLHWEMFSGSSMKNMLDIRNGGMSFAGGLLGGIIFGALYCLIRRVTFMRVADTVSMGLVITQMIAAWGNFFSRECFGEYTDSIFAMQLPVDAVDKSLITPLMLEHVTEANGISYIQVHPLFLYESIWYLFLFFVLASYAHKKKYTGEIFIRYLSGYLMGCGLIQLFVSNQIMIPGTEIPMIPVGFAATAVILWIVAAIRRSLWKKREKYSRRRRNTYDSGEKKSGLNYDEIDTYEDVSHEFLKEELPEEAVAAEDSQEKENLNAEAEEEQNEKNSAEEAEADTSVEEAEADTSETEEESSDEDGEATVEESISEEAAVEEDCKENLEQQEETKIEE